MLAQLLPKTLWIRKCSRAFFLTLVAHYSLLQFSSNIALIVSLMRLAIPDGESRVLLRFQILKSLASLFQREISFSNVLESAETSELLGIVIAESCSNVVLLEQILNLLGTYSSKESIQVDSMLCLMMKSSGISVFVSALLGWLESKEAESYLSEKIYLLLLNAALSG